jgi:peptidoglycan/xylan/chitin deacetylase (PgdA/CDA1 family)
MRAIDKYVLLHTAKPPLVYKWAMSQAIYRIGSDQKQVFLTFDDGPIPGVTDMALDLLSQFEAKATFFCLGKNVEANPELFRRIQAEGHSIGNHSYSHPDGWKTANKDYFSDIEKAEKVISSKLFRPPYGKLTPIQYHLLKKKFTIVLWDTLSLDYNQELDAEFCWNTVKNNTRAGSIIVFHDSIKAAPRMLPALKKTLEWLKGEGFEMNTITQQ